MNYSRFLTAQSAARKPSAIRLLSESRGRRLPPRCGCPPRAAEYGADSCRLAAVVHSPVRAPWDAGSASRHKRARVLVRTALGLERKAGNWVSLLRVVGAAIERDTGCCILGRERACCLERLFLGRWVGVRHSVQMREKRASHQAWQAGRG